MVCLDTSFLIDTIKGKETVKKLEDEFVNNKIILNIASPSIIEIFKGLYLKANLKNITEDEINKIDDILSSFVILNLDKTSAALAGRIEAELTNKGELIDIEAIMIGAICLINKERLITRNVKHFERISGLEIESY